MMYIILAIIFFCLGIIFLIKFSNWEKVWDCYLTTMFFTASLFMVGNYFADKPQAIDVYRGKTTLEITYRDGVPVDSVVIFKTK